MSYPNEMIGQHHSMFIEPAYRQTPDYRMFWDKLGRGEYDAGQYKRIGKGGKEVWIQASYNPISIPTASPSRWSNTRPTSPRRSRPPNSAGGGRQVQAVVEPPRKTISAPYPA